MFGHINEAFAKQMSVLSKSLVSYTELMHFYQSSINDSIMKNQEILRASISAINQSCNYSVSQSSNSLRELCKILQSKQVKSLSSINMPDLAKSFQPLLGADIMQNYKDIISTQGYTLSKMAKVMQEAFNEQRYNFTRISEIMQNTISQVDLSQVSIDELSEEVAEQYVEDELEEQIAEEAIISERQTFDKNKIKEIVKLWIIRMISFINILSSFMTVDGYFKSKPEVVNNTYVNIVQVNNECIKELNMDAEFINDLGYRIINRNNVYPRIKPDCSSRVTGHLHTGQVVKKLDEKKILNKKKKSYKKKVLNRKKKWIKISWSNDKGNEYSGWIQNYKVSKFKAPKKK